MRRERFCLLLVLLLISSCSDSKDNSPPKIVQFIVPETANAGDIVTFQVVAHDPDGDPLTYIWSMDWTQLNAKTPIVRWTIPSDKVVVSVRVRVSDGVNAPVFRETELVVTDSRRNSAGPIGKCAYLACSFALSDDVPWPYPDAPDYKRRVDWRNANLRVIDVSDPSAPWEVGFCNTYYSGSDVKVAGDYVYLGCHSRTPESCENDDYYGGLSVIDVSNPRNPREVSFYKTLGLEKIQVANGYVYALSNDGKLRVIDVSNPLNPHEIGFYRKGLTLLDVEVNGDYAYLAIGDHNRRNSGLTIVDLFNPANLQEVTSYHTPNWARAVAVAKGYAYLTDDASGIHIIDLSDMKNLQEVSFYSTPDQVRTIQVAGNYTYAVVSGGGFEIIDISDPVNLHRTGTCHTPRFVYAIRISGNYAYVAGGDNNSYCLWVIDISTPANPVALGAYDKTGTINAISVADR